MVWVLKGWNVGKGYEIMCSALGSTWGTPGNLGNTVGASCQTIGNFTGHLGARVNQNPQSWHLHFLEWGLLVAILTPKMLDTDPCGCPLSHFTGCMKFPCIKLAITIFTLCHPPKRAGTYFTFKNLLCKTRDTVLGEFFHFQTTQIFSICQKEKFKNIYISKYSFL